MASASSLGLGSAHSRTGSARFRASAQRLIRMRRLAAASQPGAEPGVDAVRDSQEYDHIKADCQIDVIDYGQEKSSFREFDNKGFLRYLSTVGKGKDDWAKVRWINIKGMDWSIIKALSLIYGLHPLALEDVLHARDCRSKADYYRDQLFVQGLALLLVNEDDDSDDLDVDGATINNDLDPVLIQTTVNEAAASGTSLSETAVTSGHGHTSEHGGRSWLGRKLFGHEDEKTSPDDLEAGRSPYGRTRVSTQTLMLQTNRKSRTAERNVQRLRGEKRVKVRERNMYIFMFRDGTLITLHESKKSVNDDAIKERLRQPNTLLRGTAEPSVLLHGLLDLMVDHAIQVVDAFQDQILVLEQETLLRPHMDSVKLLHMLSADLTLHKRALKPLQSLVYGMRRYDLDRCVAMAASVNGSSAPDLSKVKGFLSHQAKVYLADVHDHLEYVIASLEMFETITENLISYSFNVLSYDMNEIMRRLTLATLIFFPLTFLSGYFGMNFTRFSAIEGSDLLFWKIAIPSMSALILLFCWSDVTRLFKYMFAVRELPQKFHRVGSLYEQFPARTTANGNSPPDLMQAHTRLGIGLGGSVLKNHRSRA
ncbi:hypothetical protein M407DRAFT_74306 [Tulasnella calospora MUT 4182]|uniref:Uncharacterized protein n=1 Tax=Tulasnella calospora MUT 4182 TaxID=1051891 RepID=A0A0C3KYY3_9AGAM|nr:hypothetical protein M407DRAFT_74306 [Tulasnella calospora MUT 4182]